MIKKLLFRTILIVCLFLVSYKLRVWNYNKVPFAGQSVDEYSYSWVGLSTIEFGVPVGISGLSGYKDNLYKYINVDRIFQNGNAIDGNPMPINFPWFDHPPLMGLLTGGWAYLKGARVFEDMSVSLIRKPMVFLGAVCVPLLFVFVDINFGLWTAVVSTLIYAVSPFVVISSRMIQAENVIIPIYLLSLIFYSLFLKRKKFLFFVLSCMFSGLSVLFKLSGVSIGLGLLILVLIEWQISKNHKLFIKQIIVLLVSNFCFLSVFVLWGWFYDWDLFVSVFLSNSNRVYGLGSNLFINLFSQSKLTMKQFLGDAYYYWGWTAVFLLWSRFTKYKIVLIPLISYLFVYVFFGNQPYGWYTFPFLPFLITCLGIFLINTKFNLFKFIVNISIFGFYLSKLISYDQFSNYSFYWRICIVIFGLGMLLVDLGKNKKMIKIISVFNWILFLTNLFLAYKYQHLFTTEYWYKVN